MFGPGHLVVLAVALEHEALLPLGLGHGEHLLAAEVPPHGANVEAELSRDGGQIHKLKPAFYIIFLSPTLTTLTLKLVLCISLSSTVLPKEEVSSL